MVNLTLNDAYTLDGNRWEVKLRMRPKEKKNRGSKVQTETQDAKLKNISNMMMVVLIRKPKVPRVRQMQMRHHMPNLHFAPNPFYTQRLLPVFPSTFINLLPTFVSPLEC